MITSFSNTTLKSIVPDFKIYDNPFFSTLPSYCFEYKNYFFSILNTFNYSTRFEFLNLQKSDRYYFYMVLSCLFIPYDKIVIDNNYTIITININDNLRYNLNTFYTNFDFAIQATISHYNSNNKYIINITKIISEYQYIIDTHSYNSIIDSLSCISEFKKDNLKYKLIFSDLIFDIKDYLTDLNFKSIMDSLSNIKH